MKKIVKLLVVLTMGISLIIGCFAVTGCKEKESSAVGRFDLIREDFAKNKEKEDDEKGREHLEIPANADTIEIENETYCVVREFNDLDQKEYNYPDMPKLRSQRNYILANDIELICDGTEIVFCLWKKFEGRLDGNNYKITSSEKNGGRKALFEIIHEATIENLVFSSSDGYVNSLTGHTGYSFIATNASNSVIKNCVNYFQHALKEEYRNSTRYRVYWVYFNGFVRYIYDDSLIDNCINYGDIYESNGGIVFYANNSTIRSCKNYGNLVIRFGDLGGVVSRIYGDIIVEDCENYGSIVSGGCGVGGIVGRVSHGYAFSSASIYLDIESCPADDYYTENQIVRNCKNYGDIYLLKEEGKKRIEETDHNEEKYCDSVRNTMYEFGGIAGSITKVENCINEGNFYGFENMGKKIKVKFLGGVAGAAKEVTNCENKGKIEVQKGRGEYVDNICGYYIGVK